MLNLELIRQGPETSPYPALLLIPGVCHSAQHWAHVQDELAKLEIISYALSLRGHGKSELGPVPLWRCGVKEFTADIGQAVDQILENVILVGHSMGGWLIQHYAQRNPALIKGLILVCTAGPRGPWDATWNMVFNDFGTLWRIVTRGNCWYFVETPQQARDHFYEIALPEREVRELHATMGPDSLLAYLQMLLWWPKIKTIRNANLPVMVIATNDDAIIDLNGTDALTQTHGIIATFLPGAHCSPLLPEGAPQLAQHLHIFAAGL